MRGIMPPNALAVRHCPDLRPGCDYPVHAPGFTPLGPVQKGCERALRIIPPHLGARLGAKLEPVRAWFVLLTALVTGRPTELWIGDSHAMCFNQPVSLAMFLRGPTDQLILRAGARLMWSMAQKGFPPRILRVARVAGLRGRGNFVPVFVAGEIDVRCHLPGRDPDFAFVDTYVDRALAIARTLHAPRAVFVVPPPPSATCPNIEEFPIRGTVQERIDAFHGLRAALAEAVGTHPQAELLDMTDELGDDDGSMLQDLTDDGCHTNAAGVAIVRARVGELHLLDAPMADA
jgi:hypothetical protein